VLAEARNVQSCPGKRKIETERERARGERGGENPPTGEIVENLEQHVHLHVYTLFVLLGLVFMPVSFVYI